MNYREDRQDPEKLGARLLDLSELTLAVPTTVPDIFLRHRAHHGHPVLETSLWEREQPVWLSIRQEQREVLIHVLTRFVFGMEVAQKALPELEKCSRVKSSEFCGHYSALAADTKFIVEACRQYRKDVGGVDDDPAALTPSYCRIFKEIFPELIDRLTASKNSSRREQIRAESRLRTVYHIIGEGLGAITGIWGMNAALFQLSNPEDESGQRESAKLKGLIQLVGEITKIQRRNIAFGLFELGELAREAYFPTVLSVIRQLRETKPILDKMREETFGRWGDEFPFDINQRQLAALGQKRVIGWLAREVIGQPYWMSRTRLRSLSDII